MTRAPRIRSLTLALAPAFLACSGGNGPYTIAAAGPTGIASGRNTKLGVTLAVDEINRSGGINGHRLELRYSDDNSDGGEAAKVAQQFVENSAVSAVVGHGTSGAMVAAARIYDGKLAAVSPSASSPDISNISRWTFRIISSDSVNGAEMAKYAAATGHTRAAILYENDNFGRGLAEAFRRNWTGTLISDDPFTADGRNAEVFVSYFKLKQPDLVFVAGREISGVALIAEARKQGLKTDFMGGNGWTPLSNHADIAEGVFVGAPFSTSDPRPEAQKFVARFRAINGGQLPDGNSALGYDATKLVAAALAAVGPDRKAIRDWLAAMSKPFDGVTGPIRFLDSGDPANRSLTITRVKRDGTLEVVRTK